MLISRRSLLLSTAGAAVMINQNCHARGVPLVFYDRDAVTFNGTLLSGTLVNFPPDCPNVTLAYNFRGTAAQAPVSSNTQRTILLQAPGNQTNTIMLTHARGTSGPIVQMTVFGGAGQGGFINAPVSYDGFWHEIVLSVNTATGGSVMIDGTLATVSQNWQGGPYGVDYSKQFLVGGAGTSGKNVSFPYLGDLADLTLWAPPSLLDLTDPTIAARLWDSSNEIAIRTGPTGWRTFEDLGATAIMCLSGPASRFLRNLAAGSFTFFPPAYVDTVPTSMFTNTKGALVTAASDPWSDPAA